MSSISNSTGAFFERSLGQMTGLRKSVEKLQTQIATGERIARGSDDPIGASRLRALARIEAQGRTEAENAQALGQDLAAASKQIEGVVGLLQRVRELAVAAGSDTIGQDGREAIAVEMEQLGEELFARANSQSLTGSSLFSGTLSGAAYSRDALGNVTYQGNGQSGAVPVAPATEIERGLPGPQVFEFDLSGSPSSAFAVISGLAAALRGGVPDPAAAARDAIGGIDMALDTVNRSQTVIGTRLAWVESIQVDQQDRAVNGARQRSDIADTDIADTVVRLQQAMTALEATQASFARVSSLSLFNAI